MPAAFSNCHVKIQQSCQNNKGLCSFFWLSNCPSMLLMHLPTVTILKRPVKKL